MAEFAHKPHTKVVIEVDTSVDLQTLSAEELHRLYHDTSTLLWGCDDLPDAEREELARLNDNLLNLPLPRLPPKAFEPKHHIGGTYYDPTSPENSLVLTARHRFLRTIQVMPEARERVMEPLRAMLPLYADRSRRDELRQQIREWAEELGLYRSGKGEWILREADDTLWLWSSWPKMQCWACLRYEMWRPADNPRTRKGTKRYPERRYKLPNHYEWLALHQVLREPLPSLETGRRGREKPGNSRLPGKREKLKAVFRALRIVLDLPELPRGRPTKNSRHAKPPKQPI